MTKDNNNKNNYGKCDNDKSNNDKSNNDKSNNSKIDNCDDVEYVNWSYLNFIGGQSFSDITTKLAMNRIEHLVPNIWARTEYFRDSLIKVSFDQTEVLANLIWREEFPLFYRDSELGKKFYYAYYRLKQMYCGVKSSNLLVERTELLIATEEETEKWFRYH